MKNTADNILPKTKTIWIVLLILLVFYSVKFVFEAPRKFEVFQYDWQKLQTLSQPDTVKILTATRKNILLVAPSSFKPDKKQMYQLRRNDRTYYFTYNYKTQKHDTIKFFEVHWITNQLSDMGYNFAITAVKVPLKQKK